MKHTVSVQVRLSVEVQDTGPIEAAHQAIEQVMLVFKNGLHLVESDWPNVAKKPHVVSVNGFDATVVS